ncbi:MAG TPA: DUF2277 domain-containing protein [Pyrinomonadaceae bacterium]|jgi:hypothetical protein
MKIELTIRKAAKSDSFSFLIMCRNIKTLYNFEPPTTHEEIRAAAIQFVRKVSGFNKPSAVNADAFEAAIEEITSASKKLLDSLVTNAPPKDRAVENEKTRTRNQIRFGGS